MQKQKKILFLGLTMLMLFCLILLAACQSQSVDDSKGNEQLEDPGPVRKDYSQDNLLLKVATNPEYMPFTYYEHMVGIIGFDVDILTAMAEAGNFQIQFVNKYWDDMLSALEQGEVDLATSAISHQESLAARFDYSQAYINTSELKDYIIRQEAAGIKVSLDQDRDFVFLLAKNNEELADLLASSYNKIKDSGLYEEIFSQYFGSTPTKGFLDPNVVIRGGA